MQQQFELGSESSPRSYWPKLQPDFKENFLARVQRRTRAVDLTPAELCDQACGTDDTDYDMPLLPKIHIKRTRRQKNKSMLVETKEES